MLYELRLFAGVWTVVEVTAASFRPSFSDRSAAIAAAEAMNVSFRCPRPDRG